MKMAYHDMGSSAEGFGRSDNFTSFMKITQEDIKWMVPQAMQGNWENISIPLSEWQKSQLLNLEEPGVNCLLSMWLINERELQPGSYCNATWDNFYCWPPTPNGKTVTRQCSEVLQETERINSDLITGDALRVCLENGTWLWGNWTNYNQCADSYDYYLQKTEEERKLVIAVQYILFIGSILSFVCLATALSIFYYFKCLWCDRITVHNHLMLALMLRCTLLIVITEPFIFNRSSHYRNVDIICKIVLSVHLYATVASINWMFIQGVYLHGKLTTNVFDRETPFKIYHTIGWGLPLLLIAIFAGTLETFHPRQCWKDYSDRSEIWILLGPMIVALLANLLFLMNIMRILLTKGQRSSNASDSVQFRRAVKATLILFPLLGINNLLFLYNPGGEFNTFYVILNTFFGSTQGIFVALSYCFVSKDVRDAIRREYRRFSARRSANSSRRTQSQKRDCSLSQSTATFRTRTHFRTKFKSNRGNVDQRGSGSPSPETLNTTMTMTQCDSPSPPSHFVSSQTNSRNGSNYYHQDNAVELQDDGSTQATSSRYSNIYEARAESAA